MSSKSEPTSIGVMFTGSLTRQQKKKDNINNVAADSDMGNSLIRIMVGGATPTGLGVLEMAGAKRESVSSCLSHACQEKNPTSREHAAQRIEHRSSTFSADISANARSDAMRRSIVSMGCGNTGNSAHHGHINIFYILHLSPHLDS